ncbi:MAG: HD superfamily phosphodiesterase [Clostridium sp.]|jgi:HD superfamily phosphodiesterase
MNRIETLREYIDKILLNMQNVEERRCAYVHLYGVSQYSAMIALKRGENSELATLSGMLHDLYSYKTMISENHAHNGADLAMCILSELKLTTKEETNLICSAVYNHSDKDTVHSKFDEILKDADVFQHNLYNTTLCIKDTEMLRYVNLLKEFGLSSDFRHIL